MIGMVICNYNIMLLSFFFNQTDLDIAFELPNMAICQAPVFKNSTAYAELFDTWNDYSKKEIENLMKMTYYNHVNDTLIVVAIATSYSQALKRLTNYEMIDQVASDVLADLTHAGICTVVSFEKMKQYLITNGDINETEKDFDFQAIFLLKVSDACLFDNLSGLTFRLGKSISNRCIWHQFFSRRRICLNWSEQFISVHKNLGSTKSLLRKEHGLQALQKKYGTVTPMLKQ